jgi:hypothetical protein
MKFNKRYVEMVTINFKRKFSRQKYKIASASTVRQQSVIEVLTSHATA